MKIFWLVFGVVTQFFAIMFADGSVKLWHVNRGMAWLGIALAIELTFGAILFAHSAVRQSRKS